MEIDGFQLSLRENEAAFLFGRYGNVYDVSSKKFCKKIFLRILKKILLFCDGKEEEPSTRLLEK